MSCIIQEGCIKNPLLGAWDDPLCNENTTHPLFLVLQWSAGILMLTSTLVIRALWRQTAPSTAEIKRNRVHSLQSSFFGSTQDNKLSKGVGNGRKIGKGTKKCFGKGWEVFKETGNGWSHTPRVSQIISSTATSLTVGVKFLLIGFFLSLNLIINSFVACFAGSNQPQLMKSISPSK